MRILHRTGDLDGIVLTQPGNDKGISIFHIVPLTHGVENDKRHFLSLFIAFRQLPSARALHPHHIYKIPRHRQSVELYALILIAASPRHITILSA